MADEEEFGFSLSDTRPRSADTPERAAYGPTIEALRDFLDKVAGAKPDAASLQALAGDLRSWSQTLSGFAVDEPEQPFAHRPDLPGRGQTMVPTFVVTEADPRQVRGVVTFGRYFIGGRGAVHGGVLPLLFNDVLGRLANTGGRSRARTAYLHTNFRAIAPIETELEVHAWVDREEGRKWFLRGEIRHDGQLCADAEALFLALLPGQP